jgi:hypothetical protein
VTNPDRLASETFPYTWTRAFEYLVEQRRTAGAPHEEFTSEALKGSQLDADATEWLGIVDEADADRDYPIEVYRTSITRLQLAEELMLSLRPTMTTLLGDVPHRLAARSAIETIAWTYWVLAEPSFRGRCERHIRLERADLRRIQLLEPGDEARATIEARRIRSERVAQKLGIDASKSLPTATQAVAHLFRRSEPYESEFLAALSDSDRERLFYRFPSLAAHPNPLVGFRETTEITLVRYTGLAFGYWKAWRKVCAVTSSATPAFDKHMQMIVLGLHHVSSQFLEASLRKPGP